MSDMDESELELYLEAIDALYYEHQPSGDEFLQEQLCDEYGPVPGCYRTKPADVE